MKGPLCIDVGRAFPPPAITPYTFQPSTAPAPFLARTKGGMQRVEMLCRDLAFYASFCLCFWLPWAIRRHSSVPKQTLYWCVSRFFIFLCLADCFLFIYVFTYFYQMIFGSKPSDSPLITQTRLLLMGIHLGPTFLSVSDFFTFCNKSRKSPTTRTSLIKETGRCEIPLCKCIPSMAPHWRGANIEASPVRSLCRRERRSTTRRTCITSCTRVIIFTWTVHIPAWDMHSPQLWRPALVQPECIIKQRNVQWTLRGEPHRLCARQNSLLITFLPLLPPAWWAWVFSCRS